MFPQFKSFEALQTVKTSIVSLCMTFKSIFEDSKASYWKKNKGFPIAFVQVLRIFQLYYFTRHHSSIINFLGLLYPTPLSPALLRPLIHPSKKRLWPFCYAFTLGFSFRSFYTLHNGHLFLVHCECSLGNIRA